MIDDSTSARAEAILRALQDALVKVLDAAPAIPALVRLSLDGAELEVSWHDHPRPASPADRPLEPGMPLSDAPAEGTHAVRAPLVGTFYRSPEPGSPPFVEAGDVVRCGQQLGIIEAMKLMNTIEADCDGHIVEILVADGSPVEYDQPLVLIDPA